MLPRLIALGALMCLTALPASAQRQWRRVEEFGLRVAFPVRAQPCQNLSWTHLHGWGLPIGGDCESAKRGITILADWNAAFYRSPEEAALCSRAEGGSLTKGASLNLTFPGRRSATCLQGKPNGEMLVTVATQAWRWPAADKSGEDMRRTARVNYYGYLSTTRDAFQRDLRQFRAILQSVEIKPPA